MQLTDIFPQIPKVTHLVVTEPEVSDEGIDFWVWFRSFQGLINRQEPHFYINLGVDPRNQKLFEEHWVEYYTGPFGLPSENVNDVDSVIERYKDVVEGYVLYDNENIIQTQNLAITRCGLESLLPISPDQEKWMTRHGIPKKDDLRGKFNSDLDAAEWAIDNHWPNCYKKLYANFCIHRPSWYALSHDLEDFVVYHKGLALDLQRSRSHRRSLYLYRRMMEEADAPGVQMNWHCIWEQEKEYVAEAAKKGFFTLCSIGTPNLTVHGGVGDPDAAYTQPLPDKKDCVAKPNKTYVCLYNSDGDATWAMSDLHSGNWQAPERGSFKFGWGFLPLTVKLMPAMMQYFYETKTDNDCFWGPSSGAGYTYTHLWPEHLVDMYLSESRRLLDQTGQHGCNMVNWWLQEWWREVEDDDAVRREQEALSSGPGLVCGLGGSPYATSYLDGPIPKLHAVHIANVGRDNIGDIIKLSEECPTRPNFMFLFVQISVGIWEQVKSEMEKFEEHPDIELLSMDEFFMTLQDAIDKGLLKDELYEKTDAMAERWLKGPGRHRLPVCEQLTAELARIGHVDAQERRESIGKTGWSDLVSMEVEHVARDREGFLNRFEGRPFCTEDEEADGFLYAAYTVAWTTIRAALEAQGIYANNWQKCLSDFRETCGNMVDVAPFQKIFDAWGDWESGPPSVEETADWCDGVYIAAKILNDELGPEDAKDFANWPPRTI